MGVRMNRDQWCSAMAWAKRELPDEFAPFAAATALSMKLGKRQVTADDVRKRLRNQGR